MAGSVTSSPATLTVVLPPVLTVQPQSRTNVAGTVAAFSASATGTAPLSYQWLFNGTGIQAATGTNLTLNNVQPANAGDYRVVITNAGGSVTSSVASLTVVVPPQFASITLLPDQNLSLSLTAVSNLTYRIDASTDLLTWAALTNLPNPNGTLQFIDLAATNFSQRFYRAVWVP